MVAEKGRQWETNVSWVKACEVDSSEVMALLFLFLTHTYDLVAGVAITVLP